MFLRSWDYLKKPKAVGGMGFRHVKEANESIFLKIRWRIINKPRTL